MRSAEFKLIDWRHATGLIIIFILIGSFLPSVAQCEDCLIRIHLTGTVREATTGTPVSNAQICIDNSSISLCTDPSCQSECTLPMPWACYSCVSSDPYGYFHLYVTCAIPASSGSARILLGFTASKQGYVTEQFYYGYMCLWLAGCSPSVINLYQNFVLQPTEYPKISIDQTHFHITAYQGEAKDTVLSVYNIGEANLIVKLTQSGENFKPDLVPLECVPVFCPPEMFCAGARVANWGEADAWNVGVDFYPVPYWMVLTDTITFIPSYGEEHTMVGYWQTLPNILFLEVVVDPQNLIEESNESNNILTCPWPLGPSHSDSAKTIPAELGWLSISPDSAVIQPLSSFSFTISVNAEGLDMGEYQAKILVRSNDPVDSIVQVPVYLSVTGTGVVDEQENNTFEDFLLAQNWPNPFNPRTVIEYRLSNPGHVKLTIYNILGQKERVLVNEHQDAGSKSVIWDGKDEIGRELPSGVYFYKLETEEFTDSKKMMLLK